MPLVLLSDFTFPLVVFQQVYFFLADFFSLSILNLNMFVEICEILGKLFATIEVNSGNILYHLLPFTTVPSLDWPFTCMSQQLQSVFCYGHML
ncbi:hypothetical protein BD410DRAFT_86462 [Rickenella mellea]|uniref:Uncharacterized protein n=1 Tax=Rickenella mellea TaxID=50990 RepID=A0A4Y7PMF0_9AGAM|nr:hypothetical protein BD410DRAFT_86462 [Rickenella mellea]